MLILTLGCKIHVATTYILQLTDFDWNMVFQTLIHTEIKKFIKSLTQKPPSTFMFCMLESPRPF